MEAGFIEVVLKLRDELTAKLGDVQGKLQSFGSAALGAGAALTAGLTVPIVAVGASVIKLGMDAVESESLVSVSFGNMRGAADEWSKNLSTNLGLNQFETRKMAATIFNMTTSMGLGRAASFEMSTGVVKLAADMASFRNIPMEEALGKIRAGLVGEAEPLKAIGILVNDNTVKAYAYANGIAKQGAELTDQQKVLARYGSILKQTANDQGDLARTIDSPTNQLRLMRSRVEEAATSLGVSLIPVISSVISGISGLVPYIESAVKWFTDLPGPVKAGAVAVLAIVAAIGPLLVVLGGMATGLAALAPLFAGFTLAAVGAAAPVIALVALAAGFTFAFSKMAEGVRNLWRAFKEGNFIETLTKKEDDNFVRRWLGLSAGTKAAADGLAAVGAAAPAAAAGIGLTADALIKEAAAQAASAAKTLGASTAKKQASDAAKELADALAKIKASQVPLTDVQIRNIDALSRQGIEYGLIAKAIGASEIAVNRYLESQRALTAMMREQIALLPRLKMDPASMGVGTTGPLVAQLPKLDRSPLASQWVDALARDMVSLRSKTDFAALSTHQFVQSWDDLPQISNDVAKTTGGIGELSAALANLAQVSGGAFGGLVSDLARTVAAMDSMGKAKAAFSAGKEAGGLAGFAGMASGILGMASAAIAAGQALKGMWDAAFGSKGRDLVKEFAGSMGGFDALRAQLATLPAEGERLWIALTQGVGRNNPAQAQAAIDAVKAALAAAPQTLAAAAGYQTMAELEAVAKKAKATYDYLVESGKYSSSQIAQAFKVYQDAAQAAMSDSARAAIAASGAMTAAIQKDLAALTSSRDSLVQSIANEAPEEVMGIIEAETRARIAQVEAEMQEKQTQLDAATAAAQAAADAALASTKTAFDETRTEADNTDRHIRERFGKPIRIPIEFVYPNGPAFPGMPGVPGPGSNGGGGQSTGSSGVPTTITIPLYIDGQQVAESVVRTSKRYGLA